MSLYADYVRERNRWDVIENDDGFLAYQFGEGVCWVRELFIVPEKRNKHRARAMLDALAEQCAKKDVRFFYATVCPYARDSDAVLTMALKYGFKLNDVDPVGRVVVLRKDLNRG